MVINKYLIFLLYTVRQRLQYVRKAGEKCKNLLTIKNAWLNESTVVESCTIEDRERYIEQFLKVESCIRVVFSDILKFYSHFFCLEAVLLVLIVSVYLLFSVLANNLVNFCYFLVWYALLQITPIAFCVSMSNEFRNIETGVNILYYSNNLKRLQTNVKNIKVRLLQSTVSKIEPDCRFFKIDLRVLSTLFNVIVLLILSMVSLYKWMCI